MFPLIFPKRLLFRFAADCRKAPKGWPEKSAALPEEYRLPDFSELEGDRSSSCDFRLAWSELGLGFSLSVTGKKRLPMCRLSQPDDCEGIQLWIDTRDVHNVHRATKYCHRFLFAPSGGGASDTEPGVLWLPIRCARENPNRIASEKIRIQAVCRKDGYEINGYIPAEALSGYDPSEHAMLGFHYAIRDRELGELTWTAGSPLPHEEDPSLWGSLRLIS